MNFWKGKKVFITGHTGFKGSWLSLWLQSLDALVAGFALPPPTEPNFFQLAAVAANMKAISGDIRDFESLKTTLKAFKPDIVFHLAAQPLVRYSYLNPLETYQTNVMGTVHLLEAVRQITDVRAVVNITSDKCYDNKEWHWGYRESDPLGGHDPYSNSKASAELVTRAYWNSFFRDRHVGLASARAGNVIGGGDWANDRLIPDIIRAALNKTSVVLRNPNALRPWQHVLEPLHAYLFLAEKLYHEPEKYAEAWNFGPHENDVKPVKWITEYINCALNNDQQWLQDVNRNPHEATNLKLDCSKAKSRLGWQPRWNITQALQETIEWYNAYQAAFNLHDFSLNQIFKFQNTQIN